MLKDLKDTAIETLSILKRDNISLLLFIFPIILGFLFYVAVAFFFYTVLLEKGQEFIRNILGLTDWGAVISLAIAFLLTIFLIFITHWTFVLVVSIIASPFCDILSARVEKILFGENLEDKKINFFEIMANAVKTLFNEFKKIFFVLTLSFVAFFLGIFPLFVPVSFLISAIVFSANFLDYSWSRNNVSFSNCIKDFSNFFIKYVFSGLVFILFISVPIINLFIIPFASIYYTILYNKNKKMVPLIEKNYE